MFSKKCQKIKFQGDELLLLGDVICTEEQFRQGGVGYAIFEDGVIWRLGEIIGSADDIEFLEEASIDLSLEELAVAIINLLDKTARMLD